MATIGKNILENLTTGMYIDSRISFREYIQNACDQIDIAVKQGIVSKDDAEVDIYIDSTKKYISIKDNATGVQASKFADDLGDIANSNKTLGENKGFRGIGRLCGLAYCKTLKFSTSYSGENVKSIMICDAEKMRKMLASPIKYDINQIWDEIVSFSTEPEKGESHYFDVELFNVGDEHSDLLDYNKVIEYLSFVAPAPYKATFYLRNRIYEHAKVLGYNIDEYKILVNGNQIFKNYTTKLKEESGPNIKNYDEISDLGFKEFFNSKGEIIAWMWFGLSRFEKQIPKCNTMRGIRLRCSNIQLGDDDTLQKRNLFKESRGNYYFVGEVFTVDRFLIPNSQRDYLNENANRLEFENLLKNYFFDTLHKLYYDANGIKNAIKATQDYEDLIKTFNEKSQSCGFIDDKERIKLENEIEVAKDKSDKATKVLKKYDSIEDNPVLAVVKDNIVKQYNADSLVQTIPIVPVDVITQPKPKDGYITSSLSKLNKQERKLVSKILSIVSDYAPKDIAAEIIKKVIDELK